MISFTAVLLLGAVVIDFRTHSNLPTTPTKSHPSFRAFIHQFIYSHTPAGVVTDK